MSRSSHDGTANGRGAPASSAMVCRNSLALTARLSTMSYVPPAGARSSAAIVARAASST
jgi:hypothetical protein